MKQIPDLIIRDKQLHLSQVNEAEGNAYKQCFCTVASETSHFIL